MIDPAQLSALAYSPRSDAAAIAPLPPAAWPQVQPTPAVDDSELQEVIALLSKLQAPVLPPPMRSAQGLVASEPAPAPAPVAAAQPGEIHTVALSGDALVDGLLQGYKWGSNTPGQGATLTYSFKTPDTINISPGEDRYAEAPWFLNESEKSAVRAALAKWSEVANLNFVEVPESASAQGDLRFGGTDNLPSNLVAEVNPIQPGSTPESSDVWLGSWFHRRPDNPSGELVEGSRGFMALMHEIGHALGLKHPHHASPDNDQLLPKEYDSQRHTLMSYQSKYTASPATPQALDVQAIQYLYGKNTATNADDNTYRFDPEKPVFSTLWDSGGTNTLDASNQRGAVWLDLAPGSRSMIGPTIQDNNARFSAPTRANDFLTLAPESLVHNAVGSTYDDVLSGNQGDNTLEGGEGNDTLIGKDGTDRAVYRVTTDPQNTRLLQDAQEPNRWRVVNESGRTLLNIWRDQDDYVYVEDVRQAEDLPPGETRLGVDRLDSIELIDWRSPLLPKIS